MLTVLECVRGIKDAEIQTLKGKILNEFYNEVLSNACIKRTNGTIEFYGDNVDLLVEAYSQLLEYKYDLKKHTRLDQRFLDDGEFVLDYDLEGFDNE